MLVSGVVKGGEVFGGAMGRLNSPPVFVVEGPSEWVSGGVGWRRVTVMVSWVLGFGEMTSLRVRRWGGWGSSSVWSGWVYGGVLSLLDAPWPGRMETRLHTNRMLLGPGPAAPRGDEGPPWTLL